MTDHTNTTSGKEMASETIAGDLLRGLLTELRFMPDIWQKLSEKEQTQIVERCRERVTKNVRDAVKLIASAGRVCVTGDLKKVSMSDKVEAVFALPMRDPSLAELCEARGKACLIVVASADEHMGGVDAPMADPDQRELPDIDAAGSIIEQARRRSKDAGNKGTDEGEPQGGK
ncbi:hypothetical protein ACS7SF_02730 [Ralstonia sp. 25C]|uniref:hypothetical protein n=1 Tax=Ralstonia sp. 25C TaxID=3447363 RepID=UPI003F74F5A3